MMMTGVVREEGEEVMWGTDRSFRVTAASGADAMVARFAGLNSITWYMAEIWRFSADAQILVALE